MLASIFTIQGYDVLLRPERVSPLAEPVVQPLAERVSAVPDKQRIQFLKNVSMLVGLLITAADTAGSPSLAWRGRNAARSVRRDVARTARTAKVSGRAAKLGGKAGVKAGRLRGRMPGG